MKSIPAGNKNIYKVLLCHFNLPSQDQVRLVGSISRAPQIPPFLPYNLLLCCKGQCLLFTSDLCWPSTTLSPANNNWVIIIFSRLSALSILKHSQFFVTWQCLLFLPNCNFLHPPVSLLNYSPEQPLEATTAEVGRIEVNCWRRLIYTQVISSSHLPICE